MLNMDKILRTQLEISDKILEIVDNRDEFPRGYLQGAIEAQVMTAMQAGRDIYKEINGEK